MELLTISKAAKKLGVHPNSLRNWEKRGLIKPVRLPGGQRRYSMDELNRLLVSGQLSGEPEAVVLYARVSTKKQSDAGNLERQKYMERYCIIIHHAAALVIARRAIGFKERITEDLRQKIQTVREKLSQKANSLPGEGRGMTRKVKQLFKRLDGKISVHNGLTRYKQESFHSVWHDLKHLALSSR
ncbi:MerR family DNA-binding transcriptional regulator [Desulfurispora thermophila]|uniref:MerR family DNA-binding transcriptional regulator n=1 Tax=Desulfurispora thermophila TaxID=265470 RepID=UPI00039DD80F|nr:MerR family DNA-binding transcriptional regulator [Desulfurispora thermophila]